jgi:chaperonin GroEL (HSP60 family)
MDKLLAEEGRIVVTDNGSAILSEMEVNNPVGEYLLQVAEQQRESIGDGTTTAVLYATELLTEAIDLVEEGIHPTTIIRGYETACTSSIEALRSLARPLDDDTALSDVVDTSLTGKYVSAERARLRQLVVDAVDRVGGPDARRDHVRIETRSGYPVSSSSLVSGSVISKDPVDMSMPTEIPEADVLVLGSKETLEVDDDQMPDLSTTGETHEHVRTLERDQRSHKFVKVQSLDPDLVVIHRGVDDILADKLARAGILTFRGFGSPRPVTHIADAVGANVLTHLDEATPSDLGQASISRADDERVTVESPDAERATILLGAWTDEVTEELERSVRSALNAGITAVTDDRVIPGGAAADIAALRAVRSTARSIDGRHQLSAEAFAEAIEILPRTLVRNTGKRPVDSVNELRAAHEAGNTGAGIGAEGGVDERLGETVLDPYLVKAGALRRATDAVTGLLRIDEIVGTGGFSTKAPEDDMDRAPRPWEMV